MPSHNSCPPVLLILFNRPELTKNVINLLREVSPPKVYVSIDGARVNQSDDLEKITEVRNVLKQIDWPCDLQLRISEVNQGCKYGPYNGINWFFQNEEMGVILEDDCMPHSTFFRYCQELLVRYKNNDNVMMVSGCDFADSAARDYTDSYYFHKYHLIWGWATWRSAWGKMDLEMVAWKSIDKWKFLSKHCRSVDERLYWMSNFENVADPTENSVWDYQWLFTMWYHGGLCISPNGNLVSNVGFGVDATHTVAQCDNHSRKIVAMEFPLKHADVIANIEMQEIIRCNAYMPSRRGLEFIASWLKNGIQNRIYRVLGKSR